MDVKERARAALEDRRDLLIELSHRIHAEPELGFEEHRAARLVSSSLTALGFDVRDGVADLPTALEGTFGSGGLKVGFCAEYDALPGVGHACGHNIIAAASVGAALALAQVADGLDVTVKLFGTPAEENGGGKVLMLERGAFDGLHAALMVHPAPEDILSLAALAVDHLRVDYTGRTAHASASPHLGRNAADALTVAQVGIGLLRQHLPAGVQVHGIVADGGEAANIVPGHTSGSFYVRAADRAQLAEARERIDRCFQAGALATGCEVSIEMGAPTYTELQCDPGLELIYQANAAALGRDIAVVDKSLRRGGGSTDMGNVSLEIPAIHPMIGLDCGTATIHQPEFTEYCAKPTGDKAVVDGALALAWTAIDAASDPQTRRHLLEGGKES
jgi:amidohydrolase